EDVFHFKHLYRLAHEFLEENEWEDPEGGDKWEYFYFERIIPVSNLREHRIWWRVQYIPHESQYIRYLMKIDFRTLMMKSHEVVVDNQKYKTWKGDLILNCECWLQLDYQNKWSEHWLLKHLEKFFWERIYKKYWEAHKLEAYNKAYEFNNELKRFLKMKTPLRERKGFRGEKGIPS
ncbi:MAG: hypothetical protein ABIB43_00835, partial [archaeon]